MSASRGFQPQVSAHAGASRQDIPLSSVANVGNAAMLSTLTYQSRAVRLFSEAELHSLLQTAQARNKASNITGLLIYEKGVFSVPRRPSAVACHAVGRDPTRYPPHRC